MIDIFGNDAFSVAELTKSINEVPFVPKRIGSMGIFETKNPRTKIALIERSGDIVSLIPSKPWGSGETTKRPARRRDILPIEIPHVPYDDAVLASDVAGIREYDTDGQLQMASGEVALRLADMRRDHEMTHEYFRIGALKGKVLDADAAQSELVDLFAAFGITQHEVFFDLAGTGEGIKAACLDVIEWIEESLAGSTYSYIHSFVGKGFFQKLVNNEEVSRAMEWHKDPDWNINQQGTGTPGRGTSQVTFGDITFECYRGQGSAGPFLGAEDAHFFPVGVPDLFQQHFAPAQTFTHINTAGEILYARSKVRDDDEGADIHTESNPLMICKRPKLLVLGHSAAS